MIEELRRFLEMAKTGNVTRAAQHLYITQSALTQSIHRLEKELQTKLFSQKGKQLFLTQDGKSLIIIGEKILQLWTNAHDPYMRTVQLPTFTVGMFDNVALRLSKFLKNNLQNDRYHLELIIESSSKLLTRLQLGTVDAVLCIFNDTYQIPSHVTLLHEYSENLIPVSSQNFKNTSIEKIPFILYNKDSYTRTYIDEEFINHGIQPTIYVESTSVTFMRELALLGSGVALLPENFVKQDLEQDRLKKIKMPMRWTRKYGFFVQKQYSPQIPFVKDLQIAIKNYLC